MTLGDVIKQAIDKDLSIQNKPNKLKYQEIEGLADFKIIFSSERFPEASIECQIPYNGKEEERNYLRLYFLSMAFNAAIHGMKRFKHKKNKR